MSQLLVPIGDLITHSWHQFVRNWNQTFRIAAWFMLAPVLMFLVAISSRTSPYVSAILFPLFLLGNGVLLNWIIIRLLIVGLALDQGKPADPHESRLAWSMFFPLIWVSILTGLAVLGGTLLFVIPGIWLAISLMFARLFLIEDNIRGVQSMAASRALVKGRWWGTFWRLVIPGILFTLLSFILMQILFVIFGAIAGSAKMELVFSMYGPASSSPIAISSWYLIQGLVQMLLAPLAITWAAKLFHSLKQTRS